MTERDVVTYCRICAAACGIVATLDGSRVLKVRGDPAHPVSHGYTCPKGRALPTWHHSPARLDHPEVRGEQAPWDAALDDLAAISRRVLGERGPDALGCYLATGLAYDVNGWMSAERLIRRVGTHQRYTPVTVDNAPVLRAAELVTGNAQLNPVWDPAQARLLLLFGTNPVVSHGYGTTLADPVAKLRDFQATGGEVWVVDPRRTETANLAGHHLANRPGSDVHILAWLVRELLADGADAAELGHHCVADDVDRLRRAVAGFDLGRAAAAADVEAGALGALLDSIRRGGGLAVMCGTGVTMSRDGVLAEWLRWALLVLTGSVDRERGMVCNPGWITPLDTRRPPGEVSADGSVEAGPTSRPDLVRWLGQHPCSALADEIDAGTLRILIVAGGNPLTAFPDAERTRSALARLDALVVLDVVRTSLTEMATHVLPVAGQLERADVSMLEGVAFGGRTQHTPAVVPLAGDRKPAWWVFASLARRLEVDVLGGLDPDRCTDDELLRRLAAGSRDGYDALVASGAHGLAVRAEPGWVHDRVLPGGRWRLAPPALVARLEQVSDPEPGLVLTPRRRVRWMNSATDSGLVVDAGPDDVCVHPSEAEALGLVDGDAVRVRSAHGSLDAVVRCDPGVRPGIVSCPHGSMSTNVARLTSARVDLDRDTGMPRASGVPVTLERIGA